MAWAGELSGTDWGDGVAAAWAFGAAGVAGCGVCGGVAACGV